MALSCGKSFTPTRPAGFQDPAVPSATDATCELPIPSPLAPAPMFTNSLDYFLNCAWDADSNKRFVFIIEFSNKRISEGVLRRIGFCFQYVRTNGKISL